MLDSKGVKNLNTAKKSKSTKNKKQQFGQLSLQKTKTGGSRN